MPTWWSRKSSKSKEQRRQQQEAEQPQPHGVLQFNFIKSPIRNNNKKGKEDNLKPKPKPKTKSFDEVSAVFISRNSPRAAGKDLTSPTAVAAGGGGGGFSYCDSDSADKIGIPLPRPSVSSTQSFSNDQGLVFGSASVSGSSVSSTGSFDDHPTSHSHSQINGTRLVGYQ